MMILYVATRKRCKWPVYFLIIVINIAVVEARSRLHFGIVLIAK